MQPHDTPKLCECGCGQPARNRFKQGHNSKYALRTVEERFWQYVNKTDTCWLWTGATRDFGYGVINIDGKAERAHRASWIIHNGPIPDGLNVLHKCDNPPCVNPDHLFLGTRLDNNRDMQNKGRASGGSQGERHHQAKVTESQVLEIRSKYASGNTTLHKLGSEYGISYMTVWNIINRHTWKHLT